VNKFSQIFLSNQGLALILILFPSRYGWPRKRIAGIILSSGRGENGFKEVRKNNDEGVLLKVQFCRIYPIL